MRGHVLKIYKGEDEEDEVLVKMGVCGCIFDGLGSVN